ncbi:hypothetical protein BX600DRAFT_435895 [Xylariales sp. PMI_506]|nr:hypothetical protein BX600DRAFT_435895 [Xylariales sp. PMI_506]
MPQVASPRRGIMNIDFSALSHDPAEALNSHPVRSRSRALGGPPETPSGIVEASRPRDISRMSRRYPAVTTNSHSFNKQEERLQQPPKREEQPRCSTEATRESHQKRHRCTIATYQLPLETPEGNIFSGGTKGNWSSGGIAQNSSSAPPDSCTLKVSGGTRQPGTLGGTVGGVVVGLWRARSEEEEEVWPLVEEQSYGNENRDDGCRPEAGLQRSARRKVHSVRRALTRLCQALKEKLFL